MLKWLFGGADGEPESELESDQIADEWHEERWGDDDPAKLNEIDERWKAARSREIATEEAEQLSGLFSWLRRR